MNGERVAANYQGKTSCAALASATVSLVQMQHRWCSLFRARVWCVWDKGVQCVILETDSQEYVKLWKEGDQPRLLLVIRKTRVISSGFVEFLWILLAALVTK
jgi:hypothetical protein